METIERWKPLSIRPRCWKSLCVEIINPPAHLLKPGKHNTETVTSKIKTALSNINTIQLLWREKRNIVVTGRHTYSDVVRSWGKKRQILTRLAKNISVIPGEREERYYTGWSLKTVNCNLFLTKPKNSKSAKTRWFSESLYREVLVFWCLKTVRCVEICLSELFQYRAFATP